MNSKQKGFSTIIIVDKNQHQTKTVQVRTRYLLFFKHYMFSIGGLIIALFCLVIYLHNQNSKQVAEKEQLITQIKQLKGQSAIAQAVEVTNANSATTAHTYIQSIQAKLEKINDYLSKRGLKGFSTKAVGGSADDAKLTATEQYSLYNDYLERMVKVVSFVPMGYPRISSMTSLFGYRGDPFNSAHAEYHPGIDFRGKMGDEVKCTANGTVVHAGWRGGYGNCIIIKHINDLQTLYGHLSHINVKVGQQVKLGEVIGLVGSTGRSTGAHLHYGVLKNGKPVNPAQFLTLNN